MRKKQLPRLAKRLTCLFDEAKKFVDHYTPLVSYVEGRITNSIAGTAAQREQYSNMMSLTAAPGPRIAELEQFIDYPFEWRVNADPDEQARAHYEALCQWCDSLEQHPDAPWYGKKVVVSLVYVLQLEICDRLDNVLAASDGDASNPIGKPADDKSPPTQMPNSPSRAANSTNSQPTAEVPPKRAFPCSQRQLGAFLGYGNRSGLIDVLVKDGFVEWYEVRGEKLWVILTDHTKHQEAIEKFFTKPRAVRGPKNRSNS